MLYSLQELIHGQKWQLQELVQAIVLLCHFHSVAIFCQGTGVNLEIDHDEINSFYCKDPKLSSSDDLNSLASENDKSYLKFSCVNTMDAVPVSFFSHSKQYNKTRTFPVCYSTSDNNIFFCFMMYKSLLQTHSLGKKNFSTVFLISRDLNSLKSFYSITIEIVYL